jgi:transposase
MKTLQANRSLLRKPAKRRHYDSAFKRHLVELTLVPGASVARIALDHRVNANILFRWRRHYLREVAPAAVKPVAAWLPVTLSESNEALEVIARSVPGPGAGAGARHKHRFTPAGVIEVELTLGQLRITENADLEVLRVVLAALASK